MLTELIVFLGVVISVMGAIALFFPRQLLRGLEGFDFPSKIWPIALLRVVFGLGLWLVAADVRHPTVFRVLAVIVILAGLMLPVLGRIRIQRVLEWWLSKPPAVIRGWGVLVIGLGLYLIQALVRG